MAFIILSFSQFVEFDNFSLLKRVVVNLLGKS